jgi:UDP-N-acetyl-D-mannosaminuronic acid dehydrogenase
MFEKVCVVGLGYIGLPTASLLATKGFKVHGVDVNERIVDSIKRGEIHIYEPDLDILVKSAVHSGNLAVGIEPEPADVFVVAVPTPLNEDLSPDISYVEMAAQEIAPYLKPGNLVILESTSPVGTTEKLANWLHDKRPDLPIPIDNTDGQANMKKNGSAQIFVAHCPERVLPGQILKELVDNDRIIGGIDRESAEQARSFYEMFSNGNIILTNSRTAELCKLTENAYRDVNIAFANELSRVSDKLDINVWELIEIANRHPRVSILRPGPGVGGHCIAVDPWFIVHSAPEETRLLRAAREVNNGKPDYVVDKVTNKASRFKEPVIACLGLSFKENIDDLRESPAVEIVKQLAGKQIGKLMIVEPHINKLPDELNEYENTELADLKHAFTQADVVVLLANHRAFNHVDRDLLKEKVVIDTRGSWR